MSDSVRPNTRQPSWLRSPWNSPGKNTGVGCHFLLQCMKVKRESQVAQLCLTQRPHGLQPTRLLHPWDFPGKSTGVGCHCLLQLGSRNEQFPQCRDPQCTASPASAVYNLLKAQWLVVHSSQQHPVAGCFPWHLSWEVCSRVQPVYFHLFMASLASQTVDFWLPGTSTSLPSNELWPHPL